PVDPDEDSGEHPRQSRLAGDQETDAKARVSRPWPYGRAARAPLPAVTQAAAEPQPAALQVEPDQVEPLHVEPDHVEPDHVEPLQVEPLQVEPDQRVPAQS